MKKTSKLSDQIQSKTVACLTACNCGKKAGLILGGLVIVGLIVCACRWSCCGTKTMVVDFERVQQEATAYKAILNQQKVFEEKLQAQLNAEAEALTREEKDLADRRSKLKEAEFKKKANALQAKALDLQNRYRARYQQIGMASQLAASQIQEAVEATVQDTARRAGAGVVMNKAMTVYSSDRVDLTDRLIKALNKSVQPVAYPNPDTMNPLAGRQ